MATVAEPIPQEHVRHTKTRANFFEKSDTGRNFAKKTKDQTVRRKMVNNMVTPNRMANNTEMLAKAAVGETEDSVIWSQQPVTLQRKTPLSPMTAYAYPVYATRFSQHWMLSALEKRACARSNSRSILELRGTHSSLGHTSRCIRHSPQKTSLSPQETSSWLPTMVRRSPVWDPSTSSFDSEEREKNKKKKEKKKKTSQRPSSMSLMFHQHLLLVCQHARNWTSHYSL